MNEIATEESKLIKLNEKLVCKQASCFYNTSVTDQKDYIQSGTIALLKAIRKIDESRGIKLSTYSWKIIYRYIKSTQINRFNDSTVSYPYEPVYDSKEDFWELIPDTLEENELEIIKLKLEGYTTKNISGKLKIKMVEIEEIFQSACKKIREANK